MDSPYSYFADLHSLIPEITPDSITSRTFYTGERVKATLFRFAVGQELTEHTSAYPAVIHILDGDADLTLGGDTVEAHAGTWVSMPAQLPHGVVAKTPLTMLLLMFQSK